MRRFTSGAIRSQASGKIEYYGFRHPIVELSFGKYMLKHQKCEDGSIRASNNWFGGWSTDISLQSMLRHVEDLTALHAGLNVYKIRTEKGEETIYLAENQNLKLPEGVTLKNVEIVTIEDCLNAIKFNSGAYLLEHLK